ncbi:MAG: right-handed parallel beta-helix repeat-containing protein, partial [Candidatus Lindowbacteria bacterium]|nr:right-handed parallel beta-helix repeat-containing protein [Candidatus Lindowbacteria bacterium]
MQIRSAFLFSLFHICLILFTGVVCFVPQANAAVWYVNDTSTTNDSFTFAVGSNGNAGTTAAPFRTITFALDSAVAGDTIFVDASTYTEQINIDTNNLSLVGKDSTLTGTIIDNGDTSSGTGIYSDSQTGISIRNLRVQKHKIGIEFRDVDRFTIDDIAVDQTLLFGMQLLFVDTSTLKNSSIMNALGNGVQFETSFYNTVIGNYASLNDGGIYFLGSGTNVLTGNYAELNRVDGFAWCGAASKNATYNNTISNNISQNNGAHGFLIQWGNDSQIVIGNYAAGNDTAGFWIEAAGNVITGNRAINNTHAGYVLVDKQVFSAHDNLLANNRATDNKKSGFYLQDAVNNTIVQNVSDSNFPYQIDVRGGSSNNIIEKNEFLGGVVNPDSGLINFTSNSLDVKRNWWGTTDTTGIGQMMTGSGETLVQYTPFRLGQVDTGWGNDSVAPSAPDTVVAKSSNETSITVYWSSVTTSEQSEVTVNLTGYKVYYSTVSGTSYWAYLADASSGANSLVDSTITPGETRYYRVTSFDNLTLENESFYSDSEGSATAIAVKVTGNVWYINDSSQVGDVFTVVTGNDLCNGLSPSTPKRTIAAVMALAHQGDTIYIDDGTWSETITVDTDYLTIYGKDSSATGTIIDINDSTSIGDAQAGAYVNARIAIHIEDIRFVNVYHGITFRNADQGTIKDVSVVQTGSIGFMLREGSDNNRVLNSNIEKCLGNGIYLHNSTGNTISNVVSTRNNYGYNLSGSTGNTFTSNFASRNTLDGFAALGSSTGNNFTGNISDLNSRYGFNFASGNGSQVVVNNSAKRNTSDGFEIVSSLNDFTNNFSGNNGGAGFYINNANDNLFEQNVSDSNGNYQFSINGTSVRDTFQKNHIFTGPVQPDSGFLNNTATSFAWTRNWWNTRDTTVINADYTDVSGSFRHYPFRLTAVDTTVGADTVAPQAPDTFTAEPINSHTIRLKWSRSLTSEEPEADSALGGYRIYRSTFDEHNVWTLLWPSTGNVNALNATYIWDDPFLADSTKYFYKITSIDSAGIPDQSFYSDSTASATTLQGSAIGSNIWYVNDTSQTGDVYTTIIGNDTMNGLTPSTPKRNIQSVMVLMSEGDTLYVDHGFYTETFAIPDTNDIWVIGKDSTTSVVDGGDSTNSSVKTLYAESVTILHIYQLRLKGGYNGLEFNNVDAATVLNVTATENSNWGFYLRNGSTGNTLQSNQATNNKGHGFRIESSNSNQILQNTAYNNTFHGFQFWKSDQNKIEQNSSIGNSQYGITLDEADNNLIRSNRFHSNTLAGIFINSADNNMIWANHIDKNTAYQIILQGTSTGDSFIKNNILPSSSNSDSGVNSSASDSTFEFYRNWWGTTDSIQIGSKSTGSGAAGIKQTPFRLGEVDTGISADTVAPRTPDSVSIRAIDDTSLLITWTAVLSSEEPEAVVSQKGYSIYRSKTSDTSLWVIVGSVALGTDTFVDSGLPQFSFYCYRVTSTDTKNPLVNESYYSDSIVCDTTGGIDTSGPNIWYINDNSRNGDSYTYAVGNSTNDGLTRSTPKRFLNDVERHLTPGDTIIADSGTYLEPDTFSIDTNEIYIVGVDSKGTVFDFGDSSAGKNYGIYSSGYDSHTLRYFRVQNAYNGIYFTGVESGLIEFVKSWYNGRQGIELAGSSNRNIVRNNTLQFNLGEGIDVASSHNNTIARNLAEGNASYGIKLDAAKDNLLEENTALSNANDGIYISNSDSTTVISNHSFSNASEGIAVFNSDNADIYQNTVDSNAGYGIEISGTSVTDTFAKNNILARSPNADSNFSNTSSSIVTAVRNYWGLTDSAVIRNRIGGGGATLVAYSPFRLGAVDTQLRYDTVAPLAPDSVSAVTSSETAIVIRWTRTSGSEESEADFTHKGYRIYRSLTFDTTVWQRVAEVTQNEEFFFDSALTHATTYNYRVTSIDANNPDSFENESFYSDSIAPATTSVDSSGVNAWYVNDASVTGDSFTVVIGDDSNDGLSSTSPKLTLSALSGLVTAGDTIYLDRGVFTETFVFKVSSIHLIGVDSSATIIDPPGVASTLGLYGLSSTNNVRIVIRNLGITGAYDGIHFDNVDSSQISGCSISYNGNNGVTILNGSQNDSVFTSCILGNTKNGIEFETVTNSSIFSNEISSNVGAAIKFISADTNIVRQNTMTGNDTGIYIAAGATGYGDMITKNNIYSNDTQVANFTGFT